MNRPRVPDEDDLVPEGERPGYAAPRQPGLSRAEAEALGLVPTEGYGSGRGHEVEHAHDEALADDHSAAVESAWDETLSESPAEPEQKAVRPRARRSRSARGDDGRGIPGGEEFSPLSGEGRGDWYALRVQSNKEDTVRRNMQRRIELRGLQRKVTEIVVPTEKLAEIKNGKKRIRQVKTYPGYVLVRMIMDDETWSFVRETAGVGDFVGGGTTIDQKPFPLRPDEVNKIFGIEAPGAPAAPLKIDFSTGDKVKIREGAFENFDGIVEEIDEIKGRVKVVVTIFGRATPVELQFTQVERI